VKHINACFGQNSGFLGVKAGGMCIAYIAHTLTPTHTVLCGVKLVLRSQSVIRLTLWPWKWTFK